MYTILLPKLSITILSVTAVHKDVAPFSDTGWALSWADDASHPETGGPTYETQGDFFPIPEMPMPEREDCILHDLHGEPSREADVIVGNGYLAYALRVRFERRV